MEDLPIDNNDKPVNNHDVESRYAIWKYLLKHCKSLLSKEPVYREVGNIWLLDEDHPDFERDKQFINNNFINQAICTKDGKIEISRVLEPHQVDALKAFVDETTSIAKLMEEIVIREAGIYTSNKVRLTQRLEDSYDSLAEVFKLPFDVDVESRKKRRAIRCMKREFLAHPHNSDPKMKNKYGAISESGNMYVGQTEFEAMYSIYSGEPGAAYFIAKFGESE